MNAFVLGVRGKEPALCDLCKDEAALCDLRKEGPTLCMDGLGFCGVLGATGSLCGRMVARACDAAGIEFNNEEAHSARYDCDKTAAMFCHIVNRWRELGGLPR